MVDAAPVMIDFKRSRRTTFQSTIPFLSVAHSVRSLEHEPRGRLAAVRRRAIDDELEVGALLFLLLPFLLLPLRGFLVLRSLRLLQQQRRHQQRGG